MPAQVTNYKCPACTGPLHFVGESGKLECDYCGSSFAVAEIEALYAEAESKAAQAHAAAEAAPEDFGWSENGEGMKAYSCPSCGAELICDETTAATSCPYCGNPTIVPGQFSGVMKPEYVIPFKLSKQDAVQALKNHCKGKFFLPKAFTSENHIQEIQGVYVPFWMFDGKADGEVNFTATRTRVYTIGDEEITESNYFRVYRSGDLAFEKIPVDASTKMPDGHMDSIEPFDYSELVPFSTAYLPGFLADKYDVSAEDSQERAYSRCRESLERELMSTVAGYDHYSDQQKDIHITGDKPHYAMLPVWLLSTRWRGNNYLFAVNGQTGKAAGDLPVARGKVLATFAAIAVPLSVIGSALVMLMQ